MIAPSDRVVLGLDGCRGGWVAVTLTGGAPSCVEVVARAADAVARHRPRAVAIDMPIGLLDGRRHADTAARRALPGRASTVFSTPPKAVLDAWRADPDLGYQGACAIARRVGGRAISQQAWRLVPRIAEVDDLVRELAARPPGARPGVVEVHPELAFAVLARGLRPRASTDGEVAGSPLPRKRTWAGVAARLGLLSAVGVDLVGRWEVDAAAQPDDVLDAAVCAWVADGLALGGEQLIRFPDPRAEPNRQQEDGGRPIEVVARQPPAPGDPGT